MKRFAFAVVLAALAGSQADAQVYYTDTSYFPGTTRYFPGTVAGYYTPQFSSFGNAYFNNGVLPATSVYNISPTSSVYYGGSTVGAPTVAFGPGYLYSSSAYYSPNYYSPSTYGTTYYTPGYNTYYSPGYTTYRSGLFRRGW